MEITVSGIEDAFRGVDRRTIAKGTTRGLNKLAAQAKTQLRKRLRAVYSLQASQIGKNIKVSRARPSHLVATIWARGNRIPIKYYRARATARGISFVVKRSEGRHLWRGGFVATMPTGHQGFFYRPKPDELVRRSRKYQKPTRGARRQLLPIYEILGPSLPQLMGSDQSLTDLRAWVDAKKDAVITHEIVYEIEKRSAT